MATMQDVVRPPAADPVETKRRLAQVGSALSGAAEAAGSAAGTVATAAGAAASRLPEVAAVSRRSLIEANREIRGGSDELLIIGSALSFGFAMGLLFGGANRLPILERANQGWLSRSNRSLDH